MNCKGWGRKRPRLNLRYHRGICLQALRKMKVRFKLMGFLGNPWIHRFSTWSKNAATTFCGSVLQWFSVGISRDRIIQYNADTTGRDVKTGLKHVCTFWRYHMAEFGVSDTACLGSAVRMLVGGQITSEVRVYTNGYCLSKRWHCSYTEPEKSCVEHYYYSCYHHYLLYVGHLYIYSCDKPCP